MDRYAKKVHTVPTDPRIIFKTGYTPTVLEEARNMWALNALIAYVPHFIPQYALYVSTRPGNLLKKGVAGRVLFHANTLDGDVTSVQARFPDVTFTTLSDQMFHPAEHRSMICTAFLQLNCLNISRLNGHFHLYDYDLNNYMCIPLRAHNQWYSYRIRWMRAGEEVCAFDTCSWMLIIDLDDSKVTMDLPSILPDTTVFGTGKVSRREYPVHITDRVYRNYLRLLADIKQPLPPITRRSTRGNLDTFLRMIEFDYALAMVERHPFPHQTRRLGTWTMHLDFAHPATFEPHNE